MIAISVTSPSAPVVSATPLLVAGTATAYLKQAVLAVNKTGAAGGDPAQSGEGYASAAAVPVSDMVKFRVKEDAQPPESVCVTA